MDLSGYVDGKVLVLTYDGRVILGILKGFDQTTTLILSKAIERQFSASEDGEEVPLGLYIIRGSNVALVSSLDEERDDAIDWKRVRAQPLAGMKLPV
ncbi:hypothetical protein DFJ73DRAFT_833847 [Zopfochytrium polystomum]|nr:hypothetical protein DFJ73DRAFT_833847 [Zopfochytrium polystomum]